LRKYVRERCAIWIIKRVDYGEKERWRDIVKGILYRINDWLQYKSVSFASTVNKKWGVLLAYKYRFKKYPDLKNPHTFTEKLQWLKLNTYYRNPLITRLVDKYRVKEYLNEKGFGKYVAEVIGVYDNVREIPWEALPNQFVIKCNHASGYNIVVTDKESSSKSKIFSQVHRWMKKEYGREYAEYQYMDVKRKIVIEKFLGNNLQEYKFFCFNGKPKYFYQTVEDKANREIKYYDFYDMEKNHLDILLNKYPPSPYKPEFSEKLPEMVEIAEKLGGGVFPFVRVDFFVVNNRVYFAEFTFIPTGGYMQLTPAVVDDEWGKLLNLQAEVYNID